MDKIKLFWSKTNRWHRLIFLFIVVELRLLPSGQLGFLCNDPALSHPFTGDTISWKWLLGTTLFLPFIVMLIVEKKYNSDSKTDQSKQRAVFWYKEYLFGTLINLTIVQLLKVLVGSPRPHFFDTCNPKEAETCEASEFVSSYTCAKAHWISQSDKSFPSGHTSLAIHAGVFIAYYLHQRTRHIPRSRAIVCVQILSVASAIICGISRIIDRRHHWWDVLAGAFIAAPILLYTIRTLCGNFNGSRVSEVENNSDNNSKINDPNGGRADNVAT
ncbi:phospholipid phosphatase 1 [Amyelois transitella]|uniref:phospholipid phosphatase 1 n=1 Tax=Amyelois transitella TaxID=680683 RepID=UPI00298FFEAE|nr:phospholipid phosphatase 1 [Amyelois transitella]